jgi:glycosyltransferase involved in cell wall biosynthesis
MKRAICTVSNDLTYDQRMQRICSTLAENGWDVLLVGRRLNESKPLDNQRFRQKRLPCFFRKGFLFYAEWNLRLFLFLLFQKFDVLGTVDLDTMPGGCLAALLRGKRRVFDAHELFTEVPEVTDRPFVKGFWKIVGWAFVRFYHQAYTVGPGLAEILGKEHGRPFAVVRNVPVRSTPHNNRAMQSTRYILYQGALNEGRGIKQAIEAMSLLESLTPHPSSLPELWLAGEGDLSEKLRELAAVSPAAGRIRFLGFVKPADLKQLTAGAWLGLNLLENKGLSYYYSLANKFFDYTQAEVPGLTMAFPEYIALCAEHRVAVLLDELSAEKIAQAVRHLLDDPNAHAHLQIACRTAREVWNWENEQQILLNIWESVL